MKRITLTCFDEETGANTEMSEPFDTNCTWPALVFFYWKFLNSMGYFVEPEEIGADIEDYLNSKVGLNSPDF